MPIFKRKQKAKFIQTAGMIVLAVCVVFAVWTVQSCWGKEKILISMPAVQHSFNVRLAQTREEQERGLMFVETMPTDEGMVFLYDHPQPVQFWMKNTLIPLDMLFFDANNMLVHIEHSAQPHDLTLRGPDMNARICTVIELNGGTAQRLKIETGAKLVMNITQECLQSSIK